MSLSAVCELLVKRFVSKHKKLDNVRPNQYIKSLRSLSRDTYIICKKIIQPCVTLRIHLERMHEERKISSDFLDYSKTILWKHEHFRTLVLAFENPAIEDNLKQSLLDGIVLLDPRKFLKNGAPDTTSLISDEKIVQCLFRAMVHHGEPNTLYMYDNFPVVDQQLYSGTIHHEYSVAYHESFGSVGFAIKATTVPNPHVGLNEVLLHNIFRDDIFIDDFRRFKRLYTSLDQEEWDKVFCALKTSNIVRNKNVNICRPHVREDNTFEYGGLYELLGAKQSKYITFLASLYTLLGDKSYRINEILCKLRDSYKTMQRYLPSMFSWSIHRVLSAVEIKIIISEDSQFGCTGYLQKWVMNSCLHDLFEREFVSFYIGTPIRNRLTEINCTCNLSISLPYLSSPIKSDDIGLKYVLERVQTRKLSDIPSLFDTFKREINKCYQFVYVPR